jgi:hypothetical protein
MTGASARTRRELVLFVLLAATPALAIAGLYHLHPWPTPMAQQASYFGWSLTGLYVLMGAAGVAMSPWTVAPETPGLEQGRRWAGLALWSSGVGMLYGLSDLAINRLTPWGAHLAAVDERNGYDNAFINVHPPWSLPHYFHASILSECAFRLAPILFFGGLIGLFVRGRGREVAFWVLAVLAAMIEPLEKSVMLRKWALFGDTPMEQLMNVEAIAWQVVYAILLRRFGWPAPILARFGYYLVVRCFIQGAPAPHA